MFKPITALVILSQGLYLTSEISAGGTDAKSWRALVESLSSPMALRLAVVVLGCAVVVVTLMVVRARTGSRRKDAKAAADEGSQSASAAPDQSSAAPTPEPEAVSTAPSSTVPAPDAKATTGDRSASPSEPETDGASAAAGDASSGQPEATARPKARKKSSVRPSPQQVSPKKANAPVAPDWMQNRD